MKPVTQTKTIYYKVAQFQKKSSHLQSHLEKALELRKKPISRVEYIDPEAKYKRFINSFRLQGGMIFGQLLSYEEGKDSTILVLDEASDEFPIEALSLPPSKDGKTQEFLESVLYFGVLENHVLILQSKSLKSRDLENHLMWFFRDCTSTLDKRNAILLSDLPTKEARKRVEKMPVKKVVIGSSLETKYSEQDEGKKTSKMVFGPVGRGFDILTAALGADWRKGLKLDDSLDEANLRVNLEVSYYRKTTDAAHKILDNIATAMRHAEPDDVKVHLQDGPVLKGADLKFAGHVRVKTYNGIIDSSDLYNEMLAWLTNQIQLGTIT